MEAFLFNNFFRVPFKMYGTSLGFSYKSADMIASDSAFLYRWRANGLTCASLGLYIN